MSEGESVSKKTKLNDEREKKSDQSQIPLAGPRNEPLQPKIFELNIDCFDEIFEYLSLEDLHSFDQTCKAMNKVAGEYFKQNFSAAVSRMKVNGTHTNTEDTTGFALTSGFNRYITHILADSLHHPYFYTHIHAFESIKEISFVFASLDKMYVDRIQCIFPQLQMVRFKASIFNLNIYDNMLKLCVNLKRLHLQQLELWSQPESTIIITNKYPSLEHFEWAPIESVNELNVFFQINSNAQSFSTDSKSIWKHREEIGKFNVQLDLLEVKEPYGQKPNLLMLCGALNQLFGSGFFKRLHLFIENFDVRDSIKLTSFLGLEKLNIDTVNGNFYLPPLPNLIEFEILHDISDSDAEMIANNLVNLRCLSIGQATHENILPFIRQSMKLSKIKLNLRNKGDILKLLTFNMERGKLAQARKVTIYTSESTFLATKWATYNGDINLKFIELKRISSCD